MIKFKNKGGHYIKCGGYGGTEFKEGETLRGVTAYICQKCGHVDYYLKGVLKPSLDKMGP